MARARKHKQVGDRCPGCKREDVEFTRGANYCKACAPRAAAYYNKRYHTDIEWREKQKKAARERAPDRTRFGCSCGGMKQARDGVCWNCFKTPKTHCTKCGVPRNIAFLCNMCKPCTDLVQREKHMRTKYGITLEERDQLIVAQGGVCAACGTTAWGGKGPVIDHDHSRRGPESIRGVVCNKCNLAIGKLGDNAVGVRRALEYLERYERRFEPDHLTDTAFGGSGAADHPSE